MPVNDNGNPALSQQVIDTNGDAHVVTPTDPTKAGFVQLSTEVYDGTPFGATKYFREPEVSRDYRLRVGSDRLAFDEWMVGSAQDSGKFLQTVTTMTVAQTGGFLVLNSGSSVASAAVARVTSQRFFQIFQSFPAMFECEVQLTQTPQTNNVCEWGLFLATGTTAPTDGVLFRLRDTTLYAVVNNNAGGGGSDIETAITNFNFATHWGANITRKFIIIIHRDRAEFYMQFNGEDKLMAAVDVASAASGWSGIVGGGSLPINFRNYNSAVPATAQQLKIAKVSVQRGDTDLDVPAPHIMSMAGRSIDQAQPGSTMGQTAQHANSAAPTAFTPTNTTAPAGSTGLGGIFYVNIGGVSLAVDVDYIAQSYQNPAGTVAIPGKTLVVTHVMVDAINAGAANAAAIMTWLMTLNYGHTAVSLATAEAVTARAPRRKEVGFMSLAASAAIGQPASSRLVLPLDTPITVNPGEFLQTSIRFMAGTLTTASQQLRLAINFGGYWL